MLEREGTPYSSGFILVHFFAKEEEEKNFFSKILEGIITSG